MDMGLEGKGMGKRIHDYQANQQNRNQIGSEQKGAESTESEKKSIPIRQWVFAESSPGQRRPEKSEAASIHPTVDLETYMAGLETI